MKCLDTEPSFFLCNVSFTVDVPQCVPQKTHTRTYEHEKLLCKKKIAEHSFKGVKWAKTTKRTNAQGLSVKNVDAVCKFLYNFGMRANRRSNR